MVSGLTGFNSIDGSAWDPFSGTMLFTQEAGHQRGVIEMGSDFDPNTGRGRGFAHASMAASAAAAAKGSILMTRAMFGWSRMSAAPRL